MGTALLSRARISGTYVRYGLVSAAALGADLTLLRALLASGHAPELASAAGYSLGIVVHWFLSSRLVFAQQTRARRSSGRNRQKLLFLLSALLGLGLTVFIVAVGTALGAEPLMAKLAAIVVSFQSVWLLRRLYIFAR